MCPGCVSHLGPSPGLSIRQCVKMLAENPDSDLMIQIQIHAPSLFDSILSTYVPYICLGIPEGFYFGDTLHYMSLSIDPLFILDDCLIILSKLGP